MKRRNVAKYDFRCDKERGNWLFCQKWPENQIHESIKFTTWNLNFIAFQNYCNLEIIKVSIVVLVETVGWILYIFGIRFSQDIFKGVFYTVTNREIGIFVGIFFM